MGRDLIGASQVRAQISQIQEFSTAVSTFRGKYNCLPGDCKAAADFGFTARGVNRAGGNGDGNIEGEFGGNNARMLILGGEALLFWRDLSDANLIKFRFSIGIANGASGGAVVNDTTNPAIKDFMPKAIIGSNWVYVYSSITLPVWRNGGVNYFALTGIVDIISNGSPNNITNLAVIDAYNIDKKMDDGLPQSGVVMARLNMGNNVQWVSGGAAAVGANAGVATAVSATTCFDNGNNASVTMAYSTAYAGGDSVNCALSFQFQ